MAVGVGDAVIPIHPDLTGFARELERGLEQMIRRGGPPELQFGVDERRFAQEVDEAVRRIGAVDLEVDADTRQAMSELERIARDQTVVVDADLDDGGIRQALERISQDRTVQIKPDVDRSGISADVEAGLEDGAKSATGAGGGFAAALSGGITGIVGGAVAAGFAGLTEVFEREASADLLGARLGLDDERSAELGRQAAEVYTEAWGESASDVMATFGQVFQQLPGPLSNWDVRTATEDALTIRDVWGNDVAETLRGVGQILRNDIAETQEEAFDAIAAGLQMSGDRAEDFFDTLSEYAEPLASLGFDIEDTVGAIVGGLEAGAFQADKVGDALKEFSIRAIDGSEATREAYRQLGLDADQTAQDIAAGGETAKQAISEVIQALAGMDDKVEQDAAGVGLFGAMWEDVGPAVIAALDPAEERLEGFRGTMDSVTQQAYDNVQTRLTSGWRRFVDSVPSALEQSGALDAIDRILDRFDEDGLGGALDQVKIEWDRAWPQIERFLEESVVPTLADLGVEAAKAFASELGIGVLNAMQGVANWILSGGTGAIGPQIGVGDIVDLVTGGNDPAAPPPMPIPIDNDAGGGLRRLAAGGAVPSPMLAIVGDNTDPQPEITSPVPLMQEAFREVLAQVGAGRRYDIRLERGEEAELAHRLIHALNLRDAAEVGPTYAMVG